MSKVLFAVLIALCAAGCVVDEYGRVLPPDPVGQALFNAVDPAPVYGPRDYVVNNDIPAVRYERRTVAPVSYSDPVWVNGYYGWGERDWVWVPGRWVQRPRRDVVWNDPRYYVSDGRRYWRSGYWQ
jgi:hypothetical protein